MRMNVKVEYSVYTDCRWLQRQHFFTSFGNEQIDRDTAMRKIQYEYAGCETKDLKISYHED